MFNRLVLSLFGVIGLAVVAAPRELRAQASAHSLWVTLGDSDQLVEVDAVSFKEIRRIKVDRGVHGLAVSPDGSRVYVASDKTGNFSVDVFELLPVPM